LIICDTYEPENPIITRRWEDVMKDLSIKAPKYINIRHLELGEQKSNDVMNYCGIMMMEASKY